MPHGADPDGYEDDLDLVSTEEFYADERHRPRPSRPRQRGDRRSMDPHVEAERARTYAGQTRVEIADLLAERDRQRAKSEAKAELEREAKKAAEDQDERDRKKAEKRRYQVVTGLFGALTTAIASLGTYWATRPPSRPVEEAQKAKVEAEAAKEELVETAEKSTKIDEEQDQKLRQLGLADTEQIILQVDTADYQAQMLKAMSSRAAAVEEPKSLEPARAVADTIRKKKAEAAKRGELYDPFPDLPGAKKAD